MAVVAFNFGVEPYDLPRDDLVFSVCFYLHHYAPVLACALTTSYKNEDDGGSGGDKSSFGCAQALLFGHAWILHPLGYLAAKDAIDKETTFQPSMASGFLGMMYWASRPKIPLYLRLPVVVQ